MITFIFYFLKLGILGEQVLSALSCPLSNKGHGLNWEKKWFLQDS